MEAELREMIRSLHSKIDELSAQKKRSSKIDVPLDCQKAVRNIILQLERTEEGLDINYQQIKENEETKAKVVEETRRVYRERWSRGIISQAFMNVIGNNKQEIRREESGKKTKHRHQAKISKRKRSKLERRKKAYALLDWSPNSKSQLDSCLRIDLTSPEKSDGEDGSRRHRTPFAWESSRLCRAKQELDDIYRTDVLKTNSARRQLAFVVDGQEDATTPPPSDCPPWAISRDYKNSLLV